MQSLTTAKISFLFILDLNSKILKAYQRWDMFMSNSELFTRWWSNIDINSLNSSGSDFYRIQIKLPVYVRFHESILKYLIIDNSY